MIRIFVWLIDKVPLEKITRLATMEIQITENIHLYTPNMHKLKELQECGDLEPRHLDNYFYY